MSLHSIQLPIEAFDEPLFFAALQQGDNQQVEACKEAIARFDKWSHEQFNNDATIRRLILSRAVFMDKLLTQLWQLHNCPENAALLAVGGYGRGELHPYSDIDLVVLLRDSDNTEHQNLTCFLTSLWDIGLDIGHSVRTVSQCQQQAKDDITVMTSLIEARLLEGEPELLSLAREATSTRHMWPSAEFYRAKLNEQNERHDRFADTEYNLEPNVKSSPGGLRDLQTVIWMASRHYDGFVLTDLIREQFLTRDEVRIMLRSRDFIWRVRYALHMITGRREDRLLFDHQEKLAQLWEFRDDKRRAVEQFMQLYYRAAQALGQINDLLVQLFDQAILYPGGKDHFELINEQFHLRNSYLEANAADTFQQHPQALLEAFELCGYNPAITGISAQTIRLIRTNLDLIDDNFRTNPINQRRFLSILRAPHKMSSHIRRMHRYGVLGRYIPTFGSIVGQMQHDLFHSYTVDAHTLKVVQNMRRFLKPRYQKKFPVTSRVIAGLEKKELLYLAGLFHDIGKGRGGDHSELGAVDAEAFCRLHHLSARDRNLVVWLVRNHLVMSSVAQRKDIFDPDVVQDFARHVGQLRRLDYLMVLTVADINATNPTLWNAWRASLLIHLYTETRRALRQGLENPTDKQDWIQETQQAAQQILLQKGISQKQINALWQNTDEDYFMREKPEDVIWHTESILKHKNTKLPLVKLLRSTGRHKNAAQILVYAQDRSGLFSAVCAAMDQLGLSIQDARLYDSGNNNVLLTLYVLANHDEALTNETTNNSPATAHLTATLASADPQPMIVKRRTSRQMKHFSIPTETTISLDKAKNQTVLELSTLDRPGLLARLGQIFARFDVDLQNAKIQTLGERCEDVFYITDQQQQPFQDENWCRAFQDAIAKEFDEEDNERSHNAQT